MRAGALSSAVEIFGAPDVDKRSQEQSREEREARDANESKQSGKSPPTEAARDCVVTSAAKVACAQPVACEVSGAEADKAGAHADDIHEGLQTQLHLCLTLLC